MAKQWMARLTAVALTVAMLLTAIPAVSAADDSFEIFYGEDDLYMSFMEWGSLFYDGVGEDVTVTWEAATPGIVEFDTVNGTIHPVAVGSTVIVATASDGQTDRARVTVTNPQVWNGEGTYEVLLNGKFTTATAAFTVPEDGIYELTSDAEYVMYAEVYDAEGNYMAYDAGDDFTTGFFVVDRFKAGQTYYLYTYALDTPYKGGAAYSVTLQKSTTYTKNGIYFLDNVITAAIGDVIMPKYVIIPFDDEADVRYIERNLSLISYDGMMISARGEGNVAQGIQYTAADGTVYTDTVTIQIGVYRWVSRGTNPVSDIDHNVLYNAFVFQSDINHEFTFKCKGGEFVYAELIGENGTLDYVDGMSIGDFYLNTEMMAGEAVFLYVAFLKEQAQIDILVGKTGMPAKVTLSIPEMFCAQQTGEGEYLVYNNSGFYLKSDFGPAVGSKDVDVTYSFSNPAIVEDTGGGFFGVRGTEKLTATVTTANGLTDSVTITALEYLLGDTNCDGMVDMMDAMKLYQNSSGGAGLSGALKAMSDLNGDATVDMLDTFAVYSIASGNGIAAPDLSIDSDFSGILDPTPGDDVQDEDW